MLEPNSVKYFKAYLETSCQLPSDNLRLHPFAFRTHTHDLGTVVSGYKVSKSKTNWKLIGKMSPQKPQAFYPVADLDMVINGGEYLAARCTMVRSIKHSGFECF